MPMDDTPCSITDPQKKYIVGLVDKKDLRGNNRYMPTHEQLLYLRAGDYSQLSKLKASKVIEQLLKLNDKPIEPVAQSLPQGATSDVDTTYTLVVAAGVDPFPNATPVQALDKEGAPNPRKAQVDKLTALEEQVADGNHYYFIVDPTQVDGNNNGELFFKVSKPEPPSRYAGRVFIETRGGDFHYPVKDYTRRIAILTEILKDPVKAMNEYGIRLGVCGNCGRTLTARDSRLRGIGPICAEQLMMQDAQATDDQLALLTKLGIRKS